MSDVKQLLAEATPLPWETDDGHVVHTDWHDAALIVYAVNRLPDYEAAIEALERLVRAVEGHADVEPTETDGGPMAQARAALARLREKVPSNV